MKLAHELGVASAVAKSRALWERPVGCDALLSALAQVAAHGLRGIPALA
ncbi:MAG: hypothetical protein ABI580_01000 [Burkholderiaceae bacterium]